MAQFATIEEYLEHLGRFRQNAFGQRFRRQFRDSRGTAELGMLASPTAAEYEDFRQAVAAMTVAEKAAPERLDDRAIQAIAERADADPGNVAIFINGYVLARKS